MMVQDVNDGGREGVFGGRTVEWCGGGVQYEYGYSTATVVREGVLLLLLCLSLRRGLRALAWPSHFVLRSL